MRLVHTALLALLAASVTTTAAPADGTAAEWESRFKQEPNPANMREAMRRLSARPHHLGSAYDRENAEWILARFREWGLDAQIETFDVLFPTPKERLVEMLEPKRFQKPAVPDVQPVAPAPGDSLLIHRWLRSPLLRCS